ncbi:MAG: hypothetical protein WC796_02225 [Candidatus Pacearchaeota archaeon]|jgi:hypothetical protein
MTDKLVYDVHDSKGRNISAYVEAPFDTGKSVLEVVGHEVIDLPENARLRIQEGEYKEDKDILGYGNWTREGFIYSPKQNFVFFTKCSPVIENSTEATQAHKEVKEFYPTAEQIERAIDPSVCFKVPYGQKPIPTNRFGEDPLTVFAFEDWAESYGEFLANLKSPTIPWMPVRLVVRAYASEQLGVFARQNWLYGLGGNGMSCLDSYYKGLDSCDRVRGKLRVDKH